MGGYQALVIGYQHPNGYKWGDLVPVVSAPTRKLARAILREHLSKSVTPFNIRRLWMISRRKKIRGYSRRRRLRLRRRESNQVEALILMSLAALYKAKNEANNMDSHATKLGDENVTRD